ncbi:M10 family metallopeptidase [Mesorhizobium sangaii]
MTLTNVTVTQARNGLVDVDGAKWSGSTITYSIPGAGSLWETDYGSGEPFDAQSGPFDSTQAASFRTALSLWDALIAPSITEVSDAIPGKIRVAFTDVTAREGSGTAAYAYGPPLPGNTAMAVNGDIWVDETYKSSSFAQDTSDFQILIHESGHALGLKHPFEAPTVPAGYDSRTYTVMSYTSEDYFFTWSDGGGGGIAYSVEGTSSFTPMVLDIMAIQSHYGADSTTATGNTVYTFTDNGLNGRQAIYDAGGTDTLDLTALSRGSTVDLRPGAYSDLDYYNVENQIADLTAQFGGFGDFIRNTLTDPTTPAYEWERNLGLAFSTTIENVIGSAHADTVVGNNAANVIDGRGGADIMQGGIGNDTYYVDNAGDLVIEANGQGTDNVQAYVSFNLSGQELENLALRSAASINGTGNSAANIINGNSGNNVIDGLAGADTMSGSTGNDTYYVDNAGDHVIEANGGGIDNVQAYVSFNLSGQELENLALRSAASINGTGNSIANIINGNSGNNIINGLGGADTMSGSTGNDTYYVDNAGDHVIELNGQGIDNVQAYVSFNLSGQELENLALRSSASINGTGNSAGNIITGNTGNNIIDGLGGADTMSGAQGNDTYYVDNVGDHVIELNGQGTDNVQAYVSFNLSGQELENLALRSSASINGTGNSTANIITGNTGDNIIDGLAGADTMSGAQGNDTYYVDNAGDHVIELNGQGIDNVQAYVSFNLSGQELESLALRSTGNINGTGNSIANVITGNSGNNIIDGLLGNDTLSGSIGQDTFVFTTALNASTNVDRITDFSVVDDTIQLDNGIFAALGGNGTLTADQFVKNTTGLAGDGNDHIIYETDTGWLYYDSDGSAAGGSTHFATLTANLALTNADFAVV